MQRAIVTGANGFVGTNLLRVLTANDMEVFAIIRNSKSKIEQIQNLPNVHIVYCDMNELDKLPAKIDGSADVFFHLAWNGAFGSVRGDPEVQIRNVQWTVNAVRAAHLLGCRRFVGIGTIAEYDANSYIPQPGAKPAPVSCYGIAKIMANYMSKTECTKYKIIHNWARLSHIYGKGDYTTNFVNFASKIMLTGQPANFAEGKQYMDFLSVEDAARGLYCISQKGRENTAYYVGYGAPKPMRKFLRMIRDEINPNIQLHLGVVPFNEIERDLSVFDCSSVMQDTGYQPQIPFKEGIKTVIPWIKEQIAVGKL